jgi:hypothetical protein
MNRRPVLAPSGRSRRAAPGAPRRGRHRRPEDSARILRAPDGRHPAGAVVTQCPDTTGRPVTGTRIGPASTGFPGVPPAVGSPLA